MSRPVAVALRKRLVAATVLSFSLFALAVAAFFILLFGRADRQWQIARSVTRVLCALHDGHGSCSFSAWSYHLHLEGRRIGHWRVRAVDALFRQPGHCRVAYEWHLARGLFDADELG